MRNVSSGMRQGGVYSLREHNILQKGDHKCEWSGFGLATAHWLDQLGVCELLQGPDIFRSYQLFQLFVVVLVFVVTLLVLQLIT
jgi:hypothetical protein